MYSRILGILTICLCLCACGSDTTKQDKAFAGSYVDEFGNKFVLSEDHTATIEFVGTDKVIDTNWHDGPAHNSPFATIEYNGNPNYYYMRDGVLYRHKEDMDNGRSAITIKRQNE